MDLFFPSFFDSPDGIGFVEQEPNEKIELFLRQHGIVNLGWITLALLALFLPVVLVLVDEGLQLNLLSTIPGTVQISLLLLWYMLDLAYVLENFLFWYFNIYIVTNIHLVDVDFYSLMYRKIVEIQLSDIEDVSSTIQGFFAPLFNYGNVDVETAGKSQHISFDKVSKPDFVSDRIEDLRGVSKGE